MFFSLYFFYSCGKNKEMCCWRRKIVVDVHMTTNKKQTRLKKHEHLEIDSSEWINFFDLIWLKCLQQRKSFWIFKQAKQKKRIYMRVGITQIQIQQTSKPVSLPYFPVLQIKFLVATWQLSSKRWWLEKQKLGKKMTKIFLQSMLCWSFPGDALTLFVIKERLKFVAVLYLCCCSAGTKFIAPTNGNSFDNFASWEF